MCSSDLDTLKWPFLNVRILGYSVLRPSPSPSQLPRVSSSFDSALVTLPKWYDPHRQYPNVLILAMFVCNLVMYNLMDPRDIPGNPTERLVLFVSSVVSCYTGVVYRLLANAYAGSVLQFWGRECKLLEDIHGDLGLDLGFHLFKEARRRLRNQFLLYYALMCLQVALFGVIYPIVASILGLRYFESGEINLALYISAVSVWLLLLNSHICHCIWVTGFMRVYECCLGLVKQRLEEYTRFQRTSTQIEACEIGRASCRERV